MTITEFIRARSAETYPEPRTEGHDIITAKMLPKVCALIPAGGTALDIGCGQGPALEWFREHGFEAQGIGTNDDDLRACHLAGHDVHRCDMHALGEHFGDAAFDLVWARHVLEHSVAPFYVLHEFARVLKPGGILYVEVPMPDTACCHEANANHYSVLGARMWASLIQRSGFTIEASVKMDLQTQAGPDVYVGFIARKNAP